MSVTWSDEEATERISSLDLCGLLLVVFWNWLCHPTGGRL